MDFGVPRLLPTRLPTLSSTEPNAPKTLANTPGRAYQDQLVDLAIKENIIIALGTGTGKTYIAVKLMKHLEHQITGEWENPTSKRTVFVVPTVALVIQQSDYIMRMTGIPTSGYYGAMRVDEWTKAAWDEEFKKYQILVMVHDIFKDCVNHKMLPVSRINLLVMDECHHSINDSPYREIMRSIQSETAANRPRILGLTAAVVKDHTLNKKKKAGSGLTVMEKARVLEEMVTDLERCLMARLCTSFDISLANCGADPEIVTVPFPDLLTYLPECPNARDILKQAIDHLGDRQKYYKELKKLSANPSTITTGVHPAGDKADGLYCLSAKGSMKLLRSGVNQLLTVLDNLGIWCAYKVCCMLLSDMALMIAGDVFAPEVSEVVNWVVTRLEAVKMDFERGAKVDQLQPGDSRRIMALITVKVQHLLKNLLTYRPPVNATRPGSELCCIVFVQLRYYAWALYHFVEFIAGSLEEYRFLSSGYCVGHVLPGSKYNYHPTPFPTPQPPQLTMPSSKLERTLESFRDHSINLLFATSVVEEGFDVPACNLILRFDPPVNYCSFVQSKGRGRAADSKYVVMVTQSKYRDFESGSLAEWKLTDSIIKKHCMNRSLPTEDDTEDHFDDQLVPPFCPSGAPDGPRVTLNTARCLISRYMSSLPNDRIAPGCIYHHIDEIRQHTGPAYRSTLYLPMNAVVKEAVKSDIMPTEKVARKAANLEYCKKLYSKGTLDIHLLPKKKRDFIADHPEYFTAALHEEVVTSEKVGSIDRIQYYPKKTPQAFEGSKPMPNAPCHLYVMVFSFSSERSTDVIHQHLRRTTLSFGILSGSALPKIPGFLMSLQGMDATVEMKLVSADMREDGRRLRNAFDAHVAIFKNVLRFHRVKGLHFDRAIENNAFYVVPMKLTQIASLAATSGKRSTGTTSEWKIDWQTIDYLNEERAFDCRPVPEQVRQGRRFHAEDFDGLIVIPAYNRAKEKYIVTRVLQGYVPRSPLQFSASDRSGRRLRDYFELYQSRHNLRIVDFNQSLVSADGPVKSIADLTTRPRRPPPPRPSAPGQRFRGPTTRRVETLVPEFCHIFPLAPEHYFKAEALPFILHRVASFCHIQALAAAVSSETGFAKSHTTEKLAFLRFESRLVSKKPDEAPIFPRPVPVARPPAARTTANISAVSGESSTASSSSDVRPASSRSVRMEASVEIPEVVPVVPAPRSSATRIATNSITEAPSTPAPEEEIQCGLFFEDFILKKYYKSIKKAEKGPETSKKLNNLLQNAVVARFKNLIEVVPDDPTGADAAAAAEETIEPRFRLDGPAAIPDVNLKQPEPSFLLACVTTNFAKDGVNFERLEIIGDAVVKGMVSIHAFLQFPDVHSGRLHIMRNYQTSNKRIYNLAVKRNLQDIVNNQIFSVFDNFLPPCAAFDVAEARIALLSKGWFIGPSGPPTHMVHAFSDRTLVAVVKALSGCYFLESGVRGAQLFMQWMGFKVLPPQNVEGHIEPDGDLFGRFEEVPSPIVNTENESQEGLNKWTAGFRRFEKRLAYKFANRGYLVQAFTHVSYLYNRLTDCNQRLEYLGEAILDILITRHLMEEDCCKSHIGTFRDLRRAVMDDEVLATLAVQCGFHSHLKYLGPKLFAIISEFAEKVTKMGKAPTVAPEAAVVDDTSENDTAAPSEKLEDEERALKIPVVLAEVFKAVAAAVYLDSGLSFDAVWKVYYRLLRKQMEFFINNVPENPIRKLLELKRGFFSFGEATRSADDEGYIVELRVEGIGAVVGRGTDSRSAKSEAAKLALALLNAPQRCTNVPGCATRSSAA